MINYYEKMLIKLYWKLWTSAEFESDFQSDWKVFYKELQDGEYHDWNPLVIEMAYKYLQDWEREH